MLSFLTLGFLGITLANYEQLLSIPNPPKPNPTPVPQVNSLGSLTIKETMKITFDITVLTFPKNRFESVLNIGPLENVDIPRLPSVRLFNKDLGAQICLMTSPGDNQERCYNAKTINKENKSYQVEIYTSTSLFMVAVNGNIEYYITTVAGQQQYIGKVYHTFVDDPKLPGADVQIKNLQILGCSSCDLVRNDLLNDKFGVETKLKNCETTRDGLETGKKECEDKNNKLTKKLSEAEQVISKTQLEINKYSTGVKKGKHSAAKLIETNEIIDMVQGNNEHYSKFHVYALYGVIAFILCTNIIIIAVVCSKQRKNKYHKVVYASSSDEENY